MPISSMVHIGCPFLVLVVARGVHCHIPCALLLPPCLFPLATTDDWGAADLVLATSLCFSPALIGLMQQRAREVLAPGAKLVCMQVLLDFALLCPPPPSSALDRV